MTRFVGLGGDCQVAHHINRMSPAVEKHFFDWLIVPSRTVCTLLDNKFTTFLQAEDLEPDIYLGKLAKVVDRRNNTWFLHDFEAFDEAGIAKAQSKYRYLGEKFLALLRDPAPVTFVRRWHGIDGPEDEGAARVLLATLQRHKPGSRLLYLHQDRERPPVSEPDYHSSYIPQIEGDWVGDEASWTVALAGFSAEGIAAP